MNDIIENIPQTQNEIKQELFLIRNSQASKDVNGSTSYAHAVSKENTNNDDAKNRKHKPLSKNDDHQEKGKSRNSRDSDVRNDKRFKEDWRMKKRHHEGRDSREGERTQHGSHYKFDKPQYDRYNRWNSKPNFQNHRQNDYSQTHRRKNQFGRQYNFPDFEHRRENVFDRPYITPRYQNRYENRLYNYPHYYDMRNRAYESEFLWPISNRFSVLGNY